MARTFWCRHVICQEPYESHAGMVPTVCPACKRMASWTTETPAYAKVERPVPLTKDDEQYLKRLRIPTS